MKTTKAEHERQEKKREQRKADRAEHNTEPVMPAHTTAQKRGGELRMEAALVHLDEARKTLDAACADMCAVIGGNAAYARAAKLSDYVRSLRHEITRRIVEARAGFTGSALVLDSEPTEAELANPHLRGCGRAPCTHPAPHRFDGPIDWCPACGAFRVNEETWIAPESKS